MANHIDSTFFNRELSWIKFNERVLEEAEDESHPLLERLRFLTIFSSNLDEFFMIRVAGIKEQIDAKIYERTPEGLTPTELLNRISIDLHSLITRHSDILLNDILPKLKRAGVNIRSMRNLRKEQKSYLTKFFREQIFPILTPIAVDSAHPMPKLRGLGINLMVELKTSQKGAPRVAVVPIPSMFPRFIKVGAAKNSDGFVLIEEVVEDNIEMLFPNLKILNVSTFRLTRNADLDISEAEADDLLKLIERELRKRRLGAEIRLEVSITMLENHCSYLMQAFELEQIDVYRVKGFLDIASFRQLIDEVDDLDLKYEPFTPALHPQIIRNPNIFEAITKKDILLHHPYDSFNHVVELLQSAAKDPQVLAIKQTLYRTSGKSPIVKALKEAAENGKHVTALIELKARFDEEANISWARELEQTGVNVIYGILGLKTHCKVTVIIRQEESDDKHQKQIHHYVHLSTGNYNEKTATVYTDIGLLTCDKAIGEDVSELFNVLTGYSKQDEWRSIHVAPINLRQHFKALIEDCIVHNSPENPASIQLVMNSLVDIEMIKALYAASNAGVQIDLCIRGICCLVPGVTGVSENIRVRSIVGRFLEHVRVYNFTFNNETQVFCGSADWMPRNLNRRIEVVYPIKDPDLKLQVIEIVKTMLRDNCKARLLQSNGSYVRAQPAEREPLFSAQQTFLALAKTRQKTIDTIF